MKQGLAVTWDNPDIVLKKDGVEVPSSSLDKATKYQIVARIWNGSMSCPVVSMPVYFSYLKFGVGTVNVPIGKTHVDLGVKGGPGCPAFAAMEWTTPAEPGHYCIQVWLAPADDLNFDNNLGQENTDVGIPHSAAEFRFQLRNHMEVEQDFVFDVDAYALPQLDPCVADAQVVQRSQDGPVELKQQAFGTRARVNLTRVQRHARSSHPLPTGWHVEISPSSPTLLPNQEIPIIVTVNLPDDFRGSLPVNVNAFNGTRLAGGVTLRVVRP